MKILSKKKCDSISCSLSIILNSINILKSSYMDEESKNTMYNLAINNIEDIIITANLKELKCIIDEYKELNNV